jgi:2-amino-4-hydroxy-6-hydroxymethyldihydropteridine diphosphokinase
VSVTILIALGANIGDPEAALRSAFEALDALSAGPVARSSLWTSTPVDCPPGSPVFVNAAAALAPRPGESPASLLSALQALERRAGRRPKSVHNESRPLDLDLIAWGDRVLDSPDLVLPHPRAHLRRFVLQPLAEIAPTFVLPGTHRTVADLLGSLPPDAAMRRL